MSSPMMNKMFGFLPLEADDPLLRVACASNVSESVDSGVAIASCVGFSAARNAAFSAPAEQQHAAGDAEGLPAETLHAESLLVVATVGSAAVLDSDRPMAAT